jgi:uncharacterized protein YbjT (DUF2867 family)
VSLEEDIMNEATTLVLGANGKTGRRVAERLRALQRPVRLGSRSADPAFDWDKPEGWPAALRGIGAIYISYYPDLALPGATEAIRRLTRVAVDNGVGHLVLLSGKGEAEAQRCEEIVQSSGAAWTVVRATWFNQNFDEGYLLEAVRAGEVALPAGDIGDPFVDARDIADVAVAALTSPGHTGQVYEVTGPQVLTFAQVVAQIAEASRRRIVYRQVSLDEFRSGLERSQLPREFIDLLVYLFSEVLDGRNAVLTDGVQRALGRPPRDFASYAREVAATGIWNP